MNSLVTMLGFLSLFHVIGGIAVGSTVRSWLHRQFSCRALYILIWGALFGGAPFLLGVSQFSQHGTPYYILVELAIFVGAIALTALLPDWFVESYSADQLLPIGVGGLFMIVGIGIAVTSMTTQPLTALVFLGAFGGLGGLVFAVGVRRLFKT